MRSALVGLAIVALAGCNQVYGVQETQPGDAAETRCFADDFSGDAIDPLRWTLIYAVSEQHIVEADGELQIPLPMGVNSYNGMVSVPFDMTDATLTLRMTPGLLFGFTDTEANLDASALAHFITTVGNNDMNMTGVINNNADKPVATPYSAELMYLRYVHESASQLMHFDTSPDAAEWTRRKSTPMPYMPTAAQLTLLAGGFQTPPESSVARYDDVQLIAPSCVP